jgi:hypothetical protein
MGIDPDALRLKLSHGEHIVITSALDTLLHKLQTWEAEKADTNKVRKHVGLLIYSTLFSL